MGRPAVISATCFICTILLLLTAGTAAAQDEFWSRGYSAPGLGSQFGAYVEDIDGDADYANLYLGGSFGFVTDDGRSFLGMARYDRAERKFYTYGDSSCVPPGARVYAVYAKSEDSIYMGGDFLSVDGDTSLNFFAFWDGNEWRSADPSGDGFNNVIYDIEPYASGFLVAGEFTTVDLQVMRGVAQRSGSVWEPLGTGVNRLANNSPEIEDIEVYGDDVYVVGLFDWAGGQSVSNIARYSFTDDAWYDISGGGANARIYAVDIVQNEAEPGEYYLAVTGNFSQIGGTSANRVAVYSSSTDTWTDLGSTLAPGASMRSVSALADGGVMIGGTFVMVSGADTLRNFANYSDGGWQTYTGAWAGQEYSGYNFTGTDGPVYDIEREPRFGTSHLVGGSFKMFGDHILNGFGQFDYQDDEVDVFGGKGLGREFLGLNGEVYELEEDSKGRLVVMGDFSHAGGIPAKFVVRGGWTGLNTGDLREASSIRGLATNGDTVYLSGVVLDTEPLNGRAVMQYDGTDWTYLGTYNSFDGEVYDLIYWRDALYAGGSFTEVDGVPAAGLATWNGSSWEPLSSELGYGLADPTVRKFAVNPLDSTLVVAGVFSTAGSLYAAPGVATWNGTSWSVLPSGTAPSLYPVGVTVGPGGEIVTANGYDGIYKDGRKMVLPFSSGDFRDIEFRGCDMYVVGQSIEFTDSSGTLQRYIGAVRVGIDGVEILADAGATFNDVLITGFRLYAGGDEHIIGLPDSDAIIESDFFAVGTVVDDGVPSNIFLQITWPTAGDTLYVDDGHEIEFRAQNVSELVFEISVDSGQTWTEINDGGVFASVGRVPWLVEQVGQHCIIRARDKLFTCVESTSGMFVIDSIPGRNVEWLTRYRGGTEPFLPSHHGWSIDNSRDSNDGVWADAYWDTLDYFERYTANDAALLELYERDRSFRPSFPSVCIGLGRYGCRPLLTSTLRFFQSRQEEWSGYCDGFSKTALRIFHFELGAEPSDGYFFESQERLYDRPASAFATELLGGWWLWQNNALDIGWESDHDDMTPRQTVRYFSDAWAAPGWEDHAPLIIREFDGDGDFVAGHSILPYKLVSYDSIPDTVWIYVYDNNYPGNDTIRVVADTTTNTWSYAFAARNKGVGTWGESGRGMFPGAPMSLLRQAPEWGTFSRLNAYLFGNDKAAAGSSYGAQAADSNQYFFVSSSADAILTSADSDSIGTIAGDDIATSDSLGVPLYTDDPDGIQERPGGYWLRPDMLNRVSVFGFRDSIVSVTLFGDSAVYGYSRHDADSTQTDQLSFVDGMTLVNPDGVTKAFDVVAIGLADTEERSFRVFGLPAAGGDSLDFAVDSAGILTIGNSGAERSFALELRLVSRDEETALISDSVSLPANCRLSIAPDYQNYSLSDVIVYYDYSRDGSIDDSTALDVVTDIGDDQRGELPESFNLRQNYPNPFNPTTTISFSLSSSADITLDIFNVVGQRVRRLASGTRTAGEYTVEWDGFTDSGTRAASGVYFYRLTANDRVESKKMILLK